PERILAGGAKRRRRALSTGQGSRRARGAPAGHPGAAPRAWSHRIRALILVPLLALVACESRPAKGGCRFEETRLHASAEGAAFGGVELVTHGEGARLAFSDRSGLYLATLAA